MTNEIPNGCTIAFQTKEGVDYLRDFVPMYDCAERSLLTDMVASAYVCAFCVLFPYSRIQYNKIDLVSLRLASTLCTISTSRLIDSLNYRSAIHLNQDNLVKTLHTASEVIFECACEQLHETFDPCNKEVFTTGVGGGYSIRLTDCASGQLIKANFNVNTNTPSADAQSSNYYQRKNNYPRRISQSLLHFS